jgi:predicted outer membrane repeat protein
MLQFPPFVLLIVVLVVGSTFVVSIRDDTPAFIRSQQLNNYNDSGDDHTIDAGVAVYDIVQMIKDDYELEQEQNKDYRYLQASIRCVASKAQLKTAVGRSRAGSTVRVCGERIKLGSAVRRERNRRHLSTLLSGINLSHLNIIIVCELEDPTQRCILDGEGESRIFFGFNTTLTLIGFILTNATAGSSIGGALSFHGDSIITIENSDFIGNDAAYGGAIAVTNSTLSFPLASSVVFNHNFASNSGGAIYMDYGTADLEGVMLSANSAIENVSYVMMLSITEGSKDGYLTM